MGLDLSGRRGRWERREGGTAGPPPSLAGDDGGNLVDLVDRKLELVRFELV